jgi:hypothetical protein
MASFSGLIELLTLFKKRWTSFLIQEKRSLKCLKTLSMTTEGQDASTDSLTRSGADTSQTKPMI